MGRGTCFTICFKKASPPTRRAIDIEKEVSTVENARLYSYKELQIATENFSPANKIGEGGFGSVFKGRLKDGSLAAIKVLSAESSQGIREFLAEIVTISGVEHENLIKLYGCCAEKSHRILVYGYLENNSLAQTLLGGQGSSIQFSWRTRTKICIGVARGLAFLHEEIRPPIVHRDIKASNILLDKDLNPKISDFGLAKLFPSHVTHISTRVAGTLGYLAPEYAVRGQLTRKADIYSFGVLLLEIVCGRCNTNKQLPYEEQFLLEKVKLMLGKHMASILTRMAMGFICPPLTTSFSLIQPLLLFPSMYLGWMFYTKEKLIQLVDPDLGCDFDVDEASRYLKIGLLCTQDGPKNRPSMSTVVKMLTGDIDLEDKQISKPALIEELMGLRSRKNSTSCTMSSENTTMTYPSISFTSIYDRSI